MQDPTRTRFSASSMGRLYHCPSSAARIQEVRDFTAKYASGGNTDYRVAMIGDLVHDILSKVPFYSESLGLGTKVNVWNELKKLTAPHKRKVDIGMFYYAYRAIHARNAFINTIMHKCGGRVTDVSIDFDTKRMRTELKLADGSTEPFSGLADVRVVFSYVNNEGKQCKTGILLDYKTGWLAKESKTDRQLVGLTHLMKSEMPELTDVYATLITRDNVKGSPLIYHFNERALERCKDIVAKAVGDAKVLLEGYSKASSQSKDGILPEKLEEQLFTQAKVTNHCDYCAGKAACTKLRVHLQQSLEKDVRTAADMSSMSMAGGVARLLEADDVGKLRLSKEMKEIIVGKVAEGVCSSEPDVSMEVALKRVGKMKNSELLPAFRDAHSDAEILEIFNMNPDQLKSTITAVRSLNQNANLIEKLALETENLARAYLSNNEDASMSLKPGVSRLAVKPDPDDPDMPLSPLVVYERLKDVLGGVTKDDFVHSVANCQPTLVRGLLAERLNCEEDKVMQELDKLLGVESPLMFKEGNPQVVIHEVAVDDNTVKL